MSDSELSEASHTPVPPDYELEQSLRREVVRAGKAEEDFSLRQIRTASEKRLGLPDGFYKSNEQWAAKSKEIVHDQMDNQPEVPSSPVVSKTKRPSKRTSEEQGGPSRKRQKTESEGSEAELTSPLSELDSASEAEEKPKKTKKPRKASGAKSAVSKKPAKRGAKQEENGEADGADSDSDLSSVVDDEPKPRRKSKGRDSQEAKPKKTKKSTSKPKSKAPANEDLDQAEIKRLQGWLVKCGIRKVWGKELKPLETPKAKIKHLRDMLTDAGMTGRYSIEKASQIREARELAADIEAVQEGEQRWGTGDKDAEEDEERPQRRLVRGAKNYDFLSSDGEETD